MNQDHDRRRPDLDPVEWQREHAPAGAWADELICTHCGKKEGWVGSKAEWDEVARIRYLCDDCVEWST